MENGLSFVEFISFALVMGCFYFIYEAFSRFEVGNKQSLEEGAKLFLLGIIILLLSIYIDGPKAILCCLFVGSLLFGIVSFKEDKTNFALSLGICFMSFLIIWTYDVI